MSDNLPPESPPAADDPQTPGKDDTSAGASGDSGDVTDAGSDRAAGGAEATLGEEVSEDGRASARDIALSRDLARTAARLGASEAFLRGTELSKTLSDISASVARRITSQADAANLIGSIVQANRTQLDEIARTFASSAMLTSQALRDSLSVASMYSAGQLLNAAYAQRAPVTPRASRSPEDFFAAYAVDIDGVNALLRALYLLQTKQHDHRLVWRGQQNASWAVHSSLHPQLEEAGAVNEDRLVSAEVAELNAASEWGRNTSRPLEFFADLQHHGGPTRLIDVSTDPEIACWFATEADPSLDEIDGLVLAWGRAPRIGRIVPEPVADVSADFGEVPFWHAWDSAEQRRKADWGTGSRTWTWFPPPLSDRMRAQRAGFLLEAGPILTSAVVDVFNDKLSTDWRSSEIARATSIIGLPSRHDVLSKPNEAHLVPVFALRITAGAKSAIRSYLESKGLRHSTVYPDLAGLVRHLKGPFGPR